MKRILGIAFLIFLATGAAAQTSLPIGFSHHASERLVERHIRRAWVIHVLRMPDWTEPDKQKASVHQAYGRIDDAHGQILRVVYTEVGDRELVITEFFDRAAARRAPVSSRGAGK